MTRRFMPFTPDEARRFAPFTPDEVDSLNAYQAAGYVHEFTSDRGRALVACREGWYEEGDETRTIVQDWAHAFMCDRSWMRSPPPRGV